MNLQKIHADDGHQDAARSCEDRQAPDEAILFLILEPAGLCRGLIAINAAAEKIE